MKCPNCHGNRIDSKNICEMCGFNIKKNKRNEKKFINSLKVIKWILMLFFLGFMIFLIISFFSENGVNEFFNFELYFEDIVTCVILVGGVFAIGFVVLISFALIKQGISAYNLNKSQHITEGIVVDMKFHEIPGEGDELVAPIIEYEVYGYKYRVIGDFNSHEQIGNKVKIKYNPKKPYKAVVDGSNIVSSSLGLGIFLLIMCLILGFSFLFFTLF